MAEIQAILQLRQLILEPRTSMQTATPLNRP
jgi:hypothetical protein